MINCRDEKDHYHAFVDYADYLRVWMDARITHAHTERVGSIRENLRGKYGELPRTCLRNDEERSVFQVHMHPFKLIGKKEKFGNGAKRKFSDCIGHYIVILRAEISYFHPVFVAFTSSQQ